MRTGLRDDDTGPAPAGREGGSRRRANVIATEDAVPDSGEDRLRETVVDWIERIPFTETRTYVQRVMENYQVYKMRLSGKFDIVGDLINGR